MFAVVRRVVVEPDARLVVLGDPHGDVAGVTAALAREAGPRTVPLCVGDVIGHADGAQSSALVELMRARGVACVQGNHEEWFMRGQELVFLYDPLAEKKLAPAAASWVNALPQMIEVTVGPSIDPVAVIVHSISQPFWENVEPHAVPRLMRALPGLRLVIIGHTHCPRFMRWTPGERAGETPFPFERVDEVETALPDDGEAGTLIVDAGSIASPVPTMSGLRKKGFGTYAVVDLAAGTATLRRIVKDR